MPQKPRINGHGHLLPLPEQIPDFMREQEIFWVSEDRKFMLQKNWFRPIDDPSFFIEEKLVWMEKYGIDHEVILNLSQLYCNSMPRQITNDVIRFQNDFNASVQSTHPDKFTTGFVVQAAYIEDALAEIERCVHHYGLSLLCLPTHFQTIEGQWKSIASRSVKPIFELANQLKLAIEIHPYDAPKMIALEDVHWRFHLVWMMAQTADAYHMYTLRGFQEVFPNIRVCFAHGNQFGQMNTGRRLQGYLGRPDLFEEAQDPSRALKADNLYFDTLLHDLDSLQLLVKRQGVSQVLAGMDDPYPLGEMEHVGGGYPGRLLDMAAEHNIISKDEKDRIWYDNVIEWLFGTNKNIFFNRTGLGTYGVK